MPLRQERLAHLLEVVDLTVENDLQGLVLVCDRLRAAREVDDAQPPHADAHALLDEEAVVIGAPVPNGAGHGTEYFWGNASVGREDSHDSAHSGSHVFVGERTVPGNHDVDMRTTKVYWETWSRLRAVATQLALLEAADAGDYSIDHVLRQLTFPLRRQA